MNVAPNRTIILGLQIVLDHRSLRWKDLDDNESDDVGTPIQIGKFRVALLLLVNLPLLDLMQRVCGFCGLQLWDLANHRLQNGQCVTFKLYAAKVEQPSPGVEVRKSSMEYLSVDFRLWYVEVQHPFVAILVLIICVVSRGIENVEIENRVFWPIGRYLVSIFKLLRLDQRMIWWKQWFGFEFSNKLSDHLCKSCCISFGSKPNHCLAFVNILKLKFCLDVEAKPCSRFWSCILLKLMLKNVSKLACPSCRWLFDRLVIVVCCCYAVAILLLLCCQAKLEFAHELSWNRRSFYMDLSKV